jgi:alkylation response protein AidB-like acyl-CoA dehydrogenase
MLILLLQLMQGKMADMYTTMNACRAYLYAVSRATVAGKITNKVQFTILEIVLIFFDISGLRWCDSVLR